MLKNAFSLYAFLHYIPLPTYPPLVSWWHLPLLPSFSVFASVLRSGHLGSSSPFRDNNKNKNPNDAPGYSL